MNHIKNEQIVDIIFNSVQPLTVTIIKKHNEKLEFIGSGFILELKNSYFLVTASHVLDHFLNGAHLLINANEELVRLQGIHARTATDDPNERKKDKIDLGFILIHREYHFLLTKIPHLTIDDIDYNNEVVKEKGYIIVGCPVSKNKKSVNLLEKIVRPKVLAIICWEARSDIHAQLNAPVNLTLALHYDKRKTYVDGKVTTSPDLVGLSGAPIWGMTNENKNLVSAILTEHHQGSKKSILATRINTIFPILLSVASNPNKYVI